MKTETLTDWDLLLVEKLVDAMANNEPMPEVEYTSAKALAKKLHQAKAIRLIYA